MAVRPINYSERGFAFLDILGFSELVKRSAHDAKARALVANFLDVGRVFTEAQSMIQLGVPSFFSDTFLFSMASPVCMATDCSICRSARPSP